MKSKIKSNEVNQIDLEKLNEGIEIIENGLEKIVGGYIAAVPGCTGGKLEQVCDNAGSD
jgi:hypothetical protein